MADVMKEYSNTLSKIGIHKGDIVYVASDITQIIVLLRKKHKIVTKEGQYAFLDSLVDVLQEAVGEEGTLLFPSYTWAFCRELSFDIRKTPSMVGALNDWILVNRNDFLRTKHPIYSFLVWGNDAEKLVCMDNQESWGLDSPFAYLKDSNAKLLLLNVSLQRAFTFMHFVEQSLCVPYRYHKYFLGEYTDIRGVTTRRCYSMYVRDLNINMQEYLPDSFMEDEGVMHGMQSEDFTVKVLNLNDAYRVVSDDLLNNGGRNCYHFTDYKMDWNSGNTHESEVKFERN